MCVVGLGGFFGWVFLGWFCWVLGGVLCFFCFVLGVFFGLGVFFWCLFVLWKDCVSLSMMLNDNLLTAVGTIFLQWDKQPW